MSPEPHDNAGSPDRERAQTAPDAVLQSVVGQTLVGLSHVRRSPKWSFNGRTSSNRRVDGPGPGAYSSLPPQTTSRFNSAPRCAFGTSTRGEVDKQRVPGPGAYKDHRGLGVGNYGEQRPGYSLTPRRNGRGRDTAEEPGPGAHELRTTLGDGPKYSASAKRSQSARAGGPGPGDYDNMLGAVTAKEPKWGFGTSQRPDTAGNNAHALTPGPGAYMTGSQVGEGPKFSMQARRLAARGHPSPGPGTHSGLYSSFWPIGIHS